VEDHDKVRAAVRAILEAAKGIEVVGEAAGGSQAITLTEQIHPDVLLLDLDVAVVSGEIAVGPLLRKFPKTHVLVLTSYNDLEFARGFLDRGAAGCLLKEDVPESLVDGVHAVQEHEHEGWVSPHLHV
jgi:DNA-binding NarL/FixJ family response regulator